MIRLLPLLLIFLLASCASGPSEYVLTMMQYQNATETQLIDALGPPDRVYETGGTKYLTYTKATQRIYQTGPSFGYDAYGRNIGFGQNFGKDAAIQTWRCDVFFAIRNHRVTKVGYRGNVC